MEVCHTVSKPLPIKNSLVLCGIDLHLALDQIGQGTDLCKDHGFCLAAPRSAAAHHLKNPRPPRIPLLRPHHLDAAPRNRYDLLRG